MSRIELSICIRLSYCGSVRAFHRADVALCGLPNRAFRSDKSRDKTRISSLFSSTLAPYKQMEEPRKTPHLLPASFASPRIRNQEIIAQVTTDVLRVIDIINDQEKKNFRLGVFFLVVAIATWLVGLELVNSVLKGDEYRKPWFLAFLTGSCFMLNFIPEVTCWLFSCFRAKPDAADDLSPMLSSVDLQEPLEIVVADQRGVAKAFEKPEDCGDSPIPLSRREVIVLAMQVSSIYLSYNIFVMMCLQFTSASNQTVLGSTTTMFTLFIGVYLKIDKFTVKKLICVATSLIGVVMINVSDRGSPEGDGNKFKPKNPALGNLLALAGAMCYALYLLLMKMKVGTGNKTTNERILFGWVGVCSFTVGVPVLFLVHITGIEEFSLPPNKTVALMIMINAIFSVISDYVTILAMLLTSPLVTSLSLTSSIPITIFIDFLMLRLSGNSSGPSSNLYVYGFGVLSILMSVILININITTENDLIEEVIEETLEDAIRLDEVLSPVLSPYLGSSSGNAFAHSPMQGSSIGIAPLSPSLRFFKSKKSKHGPSPLAPPPLTRDMTGLDLNSPDVAESNETTPFKNKNHHRDLYTIDSSLMEGGEVHGATLHVSGGVNHNYNVKHVDHPDN